MAVASTRRGFLGSAAGGVGAVFAAPGQRLLRAETPRDGVIRVCMIADVHQDVMPDGVDKHVRTAKKVRDVLAKANEAAGLRKVLAVFAGHAHLDYVKESDRIPHVQVNSASYVWVGGDKKHANYDAAIQKAHPSVASTCPYRDPLWALVTFDCEAGRITIEGRETEWVGPDPWAVGVPADDYSRSRDPCRPGITSRVLDG